MKKILLTITIALAFFSTRVFAGGGPASALNFTGAELVSIPYNPGLQLSNGSFSVEFWAMPTAVDGNFHWVISKDNNNTDLDYLIGLSDNNKWRFMIANLAVDINGTSTPGTNIYYHIACTYDGAVANLYVNGVLEGSQAYSGPGVTNSENILIGARTSSAAIQFFNGNIDELRIWNTARTACDINRYMNTEIPTTSAGLVANYHFNEGFECVNNSTVTTLTDASGNGYDGALGGFGLAACASNWTNPGAVVTGSDSPLAMPVVTATASSHNVCVGTSVTLTGGGASTYVWDNSVLDGVAFTPSAGTVTYTVTGTDNIGCTATATTLVTVGEPGNAGTVSASASNICVGDGSLTLSTTGSVGMLVWWEVTGGTYTFIGNGTSFMPAAPTAANVGIHQYVLTSDNSAVCPSDTSMVITVTVDAPVSAGTIFSNMTDICVGDPSLTLTTIGSTGTVNWWFDNGSGNNNFGLGTTYMPGAPSPTDAGTWMIEAIATSGNSCPNDTSNVLTLTVNSLPNVTSTPDETVCIGNNVILNGYGASTYAWDNGISDGIAFTATGTITYTVTGTDNTTGCSNTSSTTVTVNPLPNVTATASTSTVCYGDLVTLTGGGADTYTWDNSVVDGVSFSPAALGNTTYTVIGTDNTTGCSNTSSTSITVNALPTVTANASVNPVCSGSTEVLTGGGALTYTWDNGVTDGASFTPATGATTYNVTGMDVNGCMGTASILVVTSPNITPSIISNSSTTVVCGSGSPITLTAENTQWVSHIIGFSSQYTSGPWSANQIIGAPNTFPTYNDVATAWTVSSPGSTREWLELGYAVAQPIDHIDIYQTYTPGNIDTVYVKNPGTGNWDVVYSGPVTPGLNTDVIMHVTFPQTSYNVSAVRLAINNIAPISRIEIDAVGIGLSTDGTTYSWSAGATTASITDNPTADMTYTVTATNLAGCTGTATFPVFIHGLPSISGTAAVDPICEGSAQTLNGTGGYTYTWDNGVSDNVPFPASTLVTTYNVIGTDDQGCTSTGSASFTVNPLPTVTLTSAMDTACIYVTSVALTGSPAGGVYYGTTVGTDSTFFPSAAGAGLYTMLYGYTDANGCLNQATHDIFVDLCLDVTAATAQTNVSIYPNPFNDVLTIETSGNGVQSVKIMNVLGETVYQMEIVNPKTEINMNGLAKGVYIVEMKSATETVNKKVVKQ